MKSVIISLILPILSVSTTLAADYSKSASDVAWPPAQMKNLPADYVNRLHQALLLTADRIGELNHNDKPILWTRSGIGGFALGQHVDKINRYFESDSFKFGAHDKFGFSLFSLTYIRAYALFNHRTGKMKGLLSQEAEKKFEYFIWQCAKANSKLTEARRGVWDMEGSENHHMASKVSDFLAAQFLKDIPDYARQRYDDGSTLQQQYEARLAYWKKWIDEHVKRGLFIEDGGSSYQNYTIEALFNLRDLTQDPLLRKKADMFLDFVWANIAEETLRTQRSGPKTRTKEEAFNSRAYDLLFDSPGEKLSLLSKKGDFVGDISKFALQSIETNYILSTSDYYPSPAIVSLARDFSNRGTYSFIKRAPGAVAFETTESTTIPVPIKGSKWRTMDKDNTMLRCGFATSNYIMGSHGLETASKADPYRVQRWQGIVFANDPMARIGMDGKSGVTKGGYISNPFNTIQDRNLMVTMKWAPDGTPKGVDPNLWIYFSALLDTVEEDAGWIFARSGDAYAAVKVVEGGYKWQRVWEHRDTFNPKQKSFISLNSDSPIITVANDAADYNNDFEAFKTALKAQPIIYKNGVLKFATITHDGPSAPGKVNGQTVELRPSRVNDSPFIRSEWDSGVIYIRKGNETLKLDFSDPRNPVRTVNAPTTDAFPPGTGDAKPIVF